MPLLMLLLLSDARIFPRTTNGGSSNLRIRAVLLGKAPGGFSSSRPAVAPGMGSPSY